MQFWHLASAQLQDKVMIESLGLNTVVTAACVQRGSRAIDITLIANVEMDTNGVIACDDKIMISAALDCMCCCMKKRLDPLLLENASTNVKNITPRKRMT